MTQPTRKAARVALNLRVGIAGRAALERIAVHRTQTTGKKVTVSDVARDAVADYCARHDPDRTRR
jgi:hypothetical protein